MTATTPGPVPGTGLLIVGLIAGAVLQLLLMVYVVRVAITVILIAGAPLALMLHALPQTDGIARWWWRAFAGCLAIQVAQSLTLAVTVKVFLTPDGVAGGLFGAAVPGSDWARTAGRARTVDHVVADPVLDPARRAGRRVGPVVDRVDRAHRDPDQDRRFDRWPGRRDRPPARRWRPSTPSRVPTRPHRTRDSRPATPSRPGPGRRRRRTGTQPGRSGRPRRSGRSGSRPGRGGDPYARTRATAQGQLMLPLGVRRQPRPSAAPVGRARPGPASGLRGRQLALPLAEGLWPEQRPVLGPDGQYRLPLTAARVPRAAPSPRPSAAGPVRPPSAGRQLELPLDPYRGNRPLRSGQYPLPFDGLARHPRPHLPTPTATGAAGSAGPARTGRGAGPPRGRQLRLPLTPPTPARGATPPAPRTPQPPRTPPPPR